jgi:hypothetical protein
MEERESMAKFPPPAMAGIGVPIYGARMNRKGE